MRSLYLTLEEGPANTLRVEGVGAYIKYLQVQDATPDGPQMHSIPSENGDEVRVGAVRRSGRLQLRIELKIDDEDEAVQRWINEGNPNVD
jgi:hypothetical protein